MPPVRQKVEGALREISSAVGLDLQLNTSGLVVLNCEGNRTCTIEVPPHVDAAFVYVTVCPVPSANRSQILAQAMELNLFQVQPLGAWLSYEQPKDLILLCYRVLDQELDSDALSDTLFSLIESAGLLEDRLLAPVRQSSIPEAAPLFDELLGSAFV